MSAYRGWDMSPIVMSLFIKGLDMVKCFFRLGLSMGFSILKILDQIASFERRLRGAAPTPLTLALTVSTST